MRKRFKMSRIASSDNYELSRKIHAMYLQRFHEENIEVITEISSTLVIKEQKYIRVFGKLIPISEEELKIHNTLISGRFVNNSKMGNNIACLVARTYT